MHPITPGIEGSMAGSEEALRPAVLGTPQQLSPEARKRIQDLSGPRPLRFWTEVILCWVVVAGAVALGAWADHWAVSALCVFMVATRQMVLGLLLHEQVHRLGSRAKRGDWFVNVFVTYPLFVTTVEDYASIHLAHHKYFMTQKDPDFIRKSGHDWTFPNDFATLARIVIRDITGLNTIALIKGKTARSTEGEFQRRLPTPKWVRWAVYAALAAVLTLAGGWKLFLLYWVLPLLTITQLLVRWVAVIEHRYNCENASVHEITPLIRLKWWQKVVFPDLNFAMHVYHHMHPGVSFGNLPKVHQIYREAGLVDETAIFDGQGAFVKYLLRK